MNMLGNLARTAIYRLAAWEPLFEAVRKRQTSGKAVLLMYHELAADDDNIESWTVVKRRDFMQQMDYLRSKFDVVSLSQAIERMSRSDAVDRPLAVVTFDDGDRGNRDILLPIVESMGLSVTIFVATGQVQDQRPYWFDRLINALQTEARITVAHPELSGESYVINETRGARNWTRIERLLSSLKKLDPIIRERVVSDIVNAVPRHTPRNRGIAPLTADDIRDLCKSPWVTIGAHSHCHNILTQLDYQAVLASVARSKELLESWTGHQVDYFAYPNGDYNESVVSAVRAAGFKAAVSNCLRPWDHGDDLFALPRIGVGRYDWFDLFKVRLVGGIRRFVF